MKFNIINLNVKFLESLFFLLFFIEYVIIVSLFGMEYILRIIIRFNCF